VGLLDTLEDDKKKLAELTEEPEEELVEEVEEEVEELAEEEEKSEEPVVEKEPELDAAGYARLRREAAAERRKAQELEKELLELRNAQIQQPAVEKPASDPKPDKATDPVGYVEWMERDLNRKLENIEQKTTRVTQVTEQENLQRAAIQEFTSFERKFASKTPDYNPVVEHFNRELSTSIKRLNRHFTDEQVAAETTRQALFIAGEFAAQGLDPAEEMYHLTKEQYGYKEPVAEVEELKPDLKKVGANRQRNAGTGAARGVGEGALTGSTVMKMTNAEFSKLSPEQKLRVIKNA